MNLVGLSKTNKICCFLSVFWETLTVNILRYRSTNLVNCIIHRPWRVHLCQAFMKEGLSGQRLCFSQPLADTDLEYMVYEDVCYINKTVMWPTTIPNPWHYMEEISYIIFFWLLPEFLHFYLPWRNGTFKNLLPKIFHVILSLKSSKCLVFLLL